MAHTPQAARLLLNDLQKDEAIRVLQGYLQSKPEVLQEVVKWAVPALVYAPSTAITAKRHKGTVASWNEEARIGSINCPSVKQKFGVDVFFLGDQCPQRIRIGDELSFAICLEADQRPRAFDVQNQSALAKGQGKADKKFAEQDGKQVRKDSEAAGGSKRSGNEWNGWSKDPGRESKRARNTDPGAAGEANIPGKGKGKSTSATSSLVQSLWQKMKTKGENNSASGSSKSGSKKDFASPSNTSPPLNLTPVIPAGGPAAKITPAKSAAPPIATQPKITPAASAAASASSVHIIPPAASSSAPAVSSTSSGNGWKEKQGARPTWKQGGGIEDAMKSLKNLLDRQLSGRISYYDRNKSFGYITCKEIDAVFGKGVDCYLTKAQMGSHKEGQYVNFYMKIGSKGKPEAYGLKPSAYDAHFNKQK